MYEQRLKTLKQKLWYERTFNKRKRKESVTVSLYYHKLRTSKSSMLIWNNIKSIMHHNNIGIKEYDARLKRYANVLKFPIVRVEYESDEVDFETKFSVNEVIQAVEMITGTKLKIDIPSNETSNSSNSSNVTVHFWYTQWCPHCVAFRPVWDEIVNNLSPMINFVNHFEPSDDEIDEAGIEAFPSIIVEKNGISREFTGTRTVNALEEFIMNIYENDNNEDEDEEDDEMDVEDYDDYDEYVRARSHANDGARLPRQRGSNIGPIGLAARIVRPRVNMEFLHNEIDTLYAIPPSNNNQFTENMSNVENMNVSWSEAVPPSTSTNPFFSVSYDLGTVRQQNGLPNQFIGQVIENLLSRAQTLQASDTHTEESQQTELTNDNEILAYVEEYLAAQAVDIENDLAELNNNNNTSENTSDNTSNNN